MQPTRREETRWDSDGDILAAEMARARASLDDSCGQCLLFTAIQGMTDGCVLVDRRVRVFHMNRSAQEILGLIGRRVTALPFRQVCPDAALVAFLWAAVSGRGPASGELLLPSESARRVRATVSACRTSRGDPLGHVLLLRDITQERLVQVELSVAVAQKLLGLAGGDAPENAAISLTRREQDTLRLVSEGCSNGVIALRLGVSASTVASHVKRLYAKLHVKNRTQAAAWALRRELRTPSRK